MVILIYSGAALLILSLILAWMLSLVKGVPRSRLSRFFSSEKALLQAHIDYILMANLLFIFALSKIEYGTLFVYAAIVGAFSNPLLFVVLAIYPNVAKKPLTPFGFASILSFSITTIGMGGCALSWASIATN